MSLSNGLRKSIQSFQTKMRELNVLVDGTSATPAASGFDGNQIDSVVDLGAGNYTIILKRPFNVSNSNDPMAWVQPITANIRAEVTATDYDRVTVQCTDLSGVATDADIMVKITGCDNRFNY